MVGMFIAALFICIMFLLFASAAIVKISLFTLDKLIIFISGWYYTHNYFSIKFSSGNAVYFWDILAALLAVGLYTVIFKAVHKKFFIIGKLLNFIISFTGAIFVYCMLTYIFITGEKSYFLPLLNHSLMNQVVNYVFIGILAIVVWVKREDNLQETQDCNM